MILTCNSCGKKFVVPDSAITASGRMVQCGSCGNKWKQFPEGKIKKINQFLAQKKAISRPQPNSTKSTKTEKNKKTYYQKNKRKSVYTHLNI